MRKLFLRILEVAVALFLILGLWNYKLVQYGFRQLTGQLNIIWNAKPVEEVMQDPKLNSENFKKLKLVEEIRRFAMDSLQLKNSQNYTTYYDQHEKPIMWVVTGCLPYELKEKEWWFPVLGNVSYKGFFIERNAIIEESEIRKQGYETNIYSPSAWSTLGILKDPIFSGMLKRSPGRLAELIIHELTHATIYLKSSVDFNENLATFIGEKGAEVFLKSHFGEQSEEYKRYNGYLADEEIYNEYMMNCSLILDSLYHTFSESTPVKEKATKKYKLIANFMLGINNLPLTSPERYKFDFIKSRLPNNTEFMSFLRYRKKQDNFNKVFIEIYKNDLRTFITDIVNKSAKGEKLPF